MCLLAVLYKVAPDYPIVLAANRDEFYDRQGGTPRLWHAGGVRFVAPKDSLAGGTWIGCNSNQMAAAVTNRVEPCLAGGARSRGLLCADVLASPSPAEAAGLLQEETARSTYNGFNLFCADFREAFVARYDGQLQISRLDGGIYVIGNADLNDEASWKVLRTRALLDKMDLADAGSLIPGLQALCADHAEPGPSDRWADDEPLCVHREERGTLSSTVVALGDDRRASVYLHAQGAPCTTPFEDYSRMPRTLS